MTGKDTARGGGCHDKVQLFYISKLHL